MNSFEDELLKLLPQLDKHSALATEIENVFGTESAAAVARLIEGPSGDQGAWDELLTQFSDVCTNIFYDNENQVVGIEYSESGGFVWVAEYAGVYGTFGFDDEPQGPFATVEEAICADEFVLTDDADLQTGALTAAQTKMVVGSLALAGDQFRIDGTLHEFDGQNLRSIDDESDEDEATAE